MTYMVNDVGEYLEDQSHGTVGSDIFLEHMPPTPTLCTVLYAYAGSPPEIVGSIEYPMLQVKTRGSMREAAMGKMGSVNTILHTLHDTTIEGVKYLWIAAQGSMAFAGQDRGQHPVYIQNFLVCKEIE